jgi:hypothetical protein
MADIAPIAANPGWVTLRRNVIRPYPVNLQNLIAESKLESADFRPFHAMDCRFDAVDQCFETAAGRVQALDPR